MCTLSWIDAPSPEGRVREIFFNRDERHTRGPERAPFLWEETKLPFLAPQDQEAGGTWFAVNAAGIAVGLLNGYHLRKGSAPAKTRSRGLLVRDLAGSLTDCAWPQGTLDPAPYEPFTVVLLSRFEAAAYHWDGQELRLDDRPQAPFVSSSFAPETVRPHRQELWQHWTGEGPPRTSAEALAYHRHAPEGGNAWSPCMHREDAGTRSLCHAVIGPAMVRLAHTPGPPHQTPMQPPLRLPRTVPHSS